MEVKLDTSGLNWSRPPPRVLVTGDTKSFDQVILRNLRAEGFQTTYFPYEGDRKNFRPILEKIAEPLELGERWGIVAFGRAATATLDTCMKPLSKLTALVAYYPTQLPPTKTALPPNLKSVVHIAGNQNIGSPKYPNYHYPNARAGFAETNDEGFDKIAANLSWSRSLTALRKGFGLESDLESVWEEHLALEFVTKDVDNLMKTMVDQPYVNHVPTMTGGIGQQDLRRFYKDYFIFGNPPSMNMRLLSRTVGADRVVDEMIISFEHTQEVPWMLPGVKPTNKNVEVALVSVVCIRGGKLYHEHIYWDQASVLVQVGLLDPKGLPVVGVESARKVMDESGEPSNKLIKDW